MPDSAPTKIVMAEPGSKEPFADIHAFVSHAEQQGLFMLGCLFYVPAERRVLVAVNHHDTRAIIEQLKAPVSVGIGRDGVYSQVTNPAIWLEYSGGDEVGSTVLDLVRAIFDQTGNLMLKTAYSTTRSVDNIDTIFNPKKEDNHG